MVAKQDQEMLTVKEVANYLRMGTLTTYRLIQEGKIPAFKIGKQWRIKRDDLLKYIETQKLQPRRTKGKIRQIDLMELVKKEEPLPSSKKKDSKDSSETKGGEINGCQEKGSQEACQEESNKKAS